MSTPGRIRASAASRCGPARARNEDMAVLGGACVRDGASVVEWVRADATRPFLAGVFDGLGGHQGGDAASALAAARLATAVSRWSMGCSAEELAQGLEQAASDVHRELTLLGQRDAAKAGCGTTCTALVASGEALVLLHLGDSRCYRWRDGLWKQLTQDHAVAISDGSGASVNRLVHALGAGLPDLPGSMVEDLTGKCFPADVYLLVSDGVLAAAGAAPLETVFDAADADAVLDRALRHGGPDNLTAVRLEIAE